MSNASVIAAVTAALVKVLSAGLNSDPTLGGASVTTLPPDKARNGKNTNQLNLFLYQTVPNAGWRNLDLPNLVRPGERGNPPLALNLHYLLTAFGMDNNEILSQRILGNAMSVLHDRPLLDASEIKSAIADVDPGDQIERLRFTPQPFSLEEMSKLWTTFQTQYRLSTTYLATVILIDSRQPSKSALPVLARGKGDSGVFAVASSSPTISAVQPAGSLPNAQLGSDITIVGENLDGGGIFVRFNHAQFTSALELTPNPGGSASALTVHLAGPAEDPLAFTKWFPGLYTVSLVVRRPPLPVWVTNEVAFGLAPAITVSPNSASPATINLSLTCAPRLSLTQRVLLLFGNRQVAPQSINNPGDLTKPSVLTFQILGVSADPDPYPVRLRVDGVDSMPIVSSGTPPKFAFDPAQSVKVS